MVADGKRKLVHRTFPTDRTRNYGQGPLIASSFRAVFECDNRECLGNKDSNAPPAKRRIPKRRRASFAVGAAKPNTLCGCGARDINRTHHGAGESPTPCAVAMLATPTERIMARADGR